MEHLEPETAAANEEGASTDTGALPTADAATAAEPAPVDAAPAAEEAPAEEAPAVEEAAPAEAAPAEAEAAEPEAAPADDAADASAAEEAAGEDAADSEDEAAGGEEPKDAPPGIPGMDWYIIHTYSGFENKVKESLRTRADAFGIGPTVGEILIPTEDVVDMRNGKKVTTKRLLYPGYVLVQLNLDDDLWHVVRNTPRVTGFVGGGQHPVPLTADEVNQILYRQASSVDKPRPKVAYERNDRVKIIDGPFTNFTGVVEDVNEEKSTLKVMVTIFGRGTPVELQYEQVEKEVF